MDVRVMVLTTEASIISTQTACALAAVQRELWKNHRGQGEMLAKVKQLLFGALCPHPQNSGGKPSADPGRLREQGRSLYRRGISDLMYVSKFVSG